MRRWANPATLAVLWLAGPVVFFLFEAIAAASVSPSYGYSYASNYISQLGVPGWTPLAAVMNVGLCVQGLAFLVGAVLAITSSSAGHRRLFVVLASLYALGLILVASVPFGIGAPSGDLAFFHWLGALLAIFGGNAAVISGSLVVAPLSGVRWYRKTSVVIAILGYSSFLILSQPVAQPTLGIWERGSVYSVMVWQILTAALLLRANRPPRPLRPSRRSGPKTTGE